MFKRANFTLWGSRKARQHRPYLVDPTPENIRHYSNPRNLPTMENGQPKYADLRQEFLPNGMRVVDSQQFEPIRLLKHDTLSIHYQQNLNLPDGRKKTIYDQHLGTFPMNESRIIDSCVIVDVDDGTLGAIGMTWGMGVFLGERVDTSHNG